MYCHNKFLRLLSLCLIVVGAASTSISVVQAQPAGDHKHVIQSFETRLLSNVYFSEGASAGDINADGKVDVVCGPYWYQGPDFKIKHEIYEPVPQNRERYSNNFFSWVYDFNGDGYDDVFAVGFCKTPAHVYENPGPDSNSHWVKHEVIDWVSNESPAFVNVVGDDRPELICTRDGFFGFATIDWSKPFGTWKFHPVSAQIAPKVFGHGLGVGDINGDGKEDIIFSKGWFEQPKTDINTTRWLLHETSFTTSYGGAEMLVYDVDADGDNDVITSHAAHNFGLGWYEQIREDDEITFRHHLIMGSQPEQNRYGVVFSELHSLTLADIDGDGLKDIVTGKTYWSHHRQSPMWDAGAVVYWFQLKRTPQGIDWVPHLASSTPGIGRQVGVFDLNADDIPDIVVGGMNGTHVLIQNRQNVSEEKWKQAQPKRYIPAKNRADRGSPSVIEPDGKVAGAIEGESMNVVSASSGKPGVQNMSNFKGASWSGGKQLFWSGAKKGDVLKLNFDVEKQGRYEIATVLTTASDYAMISISIDGKTLGDPIDMFNSPDVGTTGLIKLGTSTLDSGEHELSIEILGANDSAKKAFMVGLDYLLLKETSKN